MRKKENNCNLDELKNQIQKVIMMMEKEQQKNHGAMVDLLIKRYRNAHGLVEKNNDLYFLQPSDFHIIGGTRAYLDSCIDYNNPVLEEMHKTEQLIKNLYDN